MAAGKAAEAGAEVLLLEKNDRIGKKLGITGKGRCNLTNATDIRGFMDNLPGNGPFLYSALARFSNQELMNFFTSLGVRLKVERGMRVFPTSDTSKDVVEALESYIQGENIQVIFNTRVRDILVKDGAVIGVMDDKGQIFQGHSIILATGGASYPGTGSTGDGYDMARRLGHTIEPLRPALVPLECKETWPAETSGLSLKNVALSAYKGDELISSEFGEMLFTRFGISGPIVLTMSERLSSIIGGEPVRLTINLKPALTFEEIDARLQRDFAKFSNKSFKNSLDRLLPKSLIPVFISLAGVDPEKKVNQISRQERRSLVTLLQGIPLTLKGTRPLREAIVTAGGVSVKEIYPGTMESRLIRGLFFAGEVIDVHGNTGGFNLQAAFSTGYLAGMKSAEYQFSRR